MSCFYAFTMCWKGGEETYEIESHTRRVYLLLTGRLSLWIATYVYFILYSELLNIILCHLKKIWIYHYRKFGPDAVMFMQIFFSSPFVGLLRTYGRITIFEALSITYVDNIISLIELFYLAFSKHEDVTFFFRGKVSVCFPLAKSYIPLYLHLFYHKQ